MWLKSLIKSATYFVGIFIMLVSIDFIVGNGIKWESDITSAGLFGTGLLFGETMYLLVSKIKFIKANWRIPVTLIIAVLIIGLSYRVIDRKILKSMKQAEQTVQKPK